MQPSETLQHGTKMVTDDTIFKLANNIFNPVLQAFQKGFTPKGAVEFIPNPIMLRPMKIDYKFYPTDIESSWFAFLSGESSRTLESWPIVKYMLEEYLVNQAVEDKELNEVYKGVWEEPEEGVPGLAGKSMDGFRKHLLDGANHPTYPINVIEGVGELNEDSIFDQLEFYDKQISELYTGKRLIHFVAQKWVRAFKSAKRANGYYFIDGADKINASIDFTQHTVIGLPSMNGTNDIFTTMTENMIHLRKRDLDKIHVDLQKQDREIKFLIHWWEAVGFGCNKLVWTTDATVNAAGGTTEPTTPEEPEVNGQP
ncbi:hypothetical protein LJC53_02045 [Bacteroidales bacterium OttesenSCG-928-C03]|nr:hypothetical protein [Bacteroidales bacterium OttesenSCG-928-C03]